GIKGNSRNRRGRIVLGDVITEVAGIKVNNFDQYLAVLEQLKAGDTVEVVTQRDGEELEFSIELSAP
ncbi:MAG: PDZ domain-containing protein, partial [Psychrosphaera sp.]|nr:PDZ domain-containing protein [Psychrosphaera sp.]